MCDKIMDRILKYRNIMDRKLLKCHKPSTRYALVINGCMQLPVKNCINKRNFSKMRCMRNKVIYLQSLVTNN